MISAVKIRFKGWGAKWDEWVVLETGKVRKMHRAEAEEPAAAVASPRAPRPKTLEGTKKGRPEKEGGKGEGHAGGHAEPVDRPSWMQESRMAEKQKKVFKWKRPREEEDTSHLKFAAVRLRLNGIVVKS